MVLPKKKVFLYNGIHSVTSYKSFCEGLPFATKIYSVADLLVKFSYYFPCKSAATSSLAKLILANLLAMFLCKLITFN